MLRPLHDNVLLEKEECGKEVTTASGIILQEKDQHSLHYAKVVAVGPKCKADIEINDKVVYKQYAGTTVEVDDKAYILVEDEDILAVFTK